MRGCVACFSAATLLGTLSIAACSTKPPAAAPVLVAPVASAAAQQSPDGEPPSAPVLAELPAGPLRKAWTANTQVWNRAVVVAPFGDVISLGARRIHVHARDTGKVLESGETCYARSRHALAFQTHERAVLACAHQVVALSFPGLQSTILAELQGAVTAAAASAEFVAYSLRGGDIRVLDASTGKEVERVVASGDVEELAWSTDLSMMGIGLENGSVIVRDRRSGVQREILKGNRRASGIAFSSDDAELFVHNASFEARVIDPRSGVAKRTHRVGPWISTTASLGPGFFATAGSGGLILYKAGAEALAIPWDETGSTPSCEGLGVSQDGSLLCAGDRKGQVVCFTTRPLSAS